MSIKFKELMLDRTRFFQKNQQANLRQSHFITSFEEFHQKKPQISLIPI
jgi:hypothetical protein